MGEGLKADEARDPAILLTGAGTWVGKLAYLTTDPMTVQEGRRVIAQAVSGNRIKARGPGHPWVNLQAQQPFKFNTPRTSPPMVLMMNEYPNGLLEAEGAIGDEGTSDLSHPGFLPLLQTMVLKVIEVHYPRCLWCHPSQTTQTGPDIPDEAGGIERRCV